MPEKQHHQNKKLHLVLGTARCNQGAARLEKIRNNKKFTCVVSFPRLHRICAGALFKVACSLWSSGVAPLRLSFWHRGSLSLPSWQWVPAGERRGWTSIKELRRRHRPPHEALAARLGEP
jgi:hypothetical protein